MMTYSLNELATRTGGTDTTIQQLRSILSDAGIVPSVNGPWIAGGALRQCITNNPLSTDIDVFFASEEQRLTITRALSTNPRATKAFTTTTAETWTVKTTIDETEKTVKIQLVFIDYYPTVEALIDTFDFTMCQIATTDIQTCVVGPFTLMDITKNRLMVHRITYPISTLRRLLKYSKQGFTVCDTTLGTLATAVADNPRLADKMDITYVD